MLRSILGSLCFAACAGLASAQTVTLETDLTGLFETPPVASTAKGHVIATFDVPTSNLVVSGTFTGFSAVAAHVHTGAAGVAGPILIPLPLSSATTFDGSSILGPADITALLHEGLYVNVHSGAFPGGEIRGQLRLPKQFRTNPVGANETPPTPSLATATGTFVLNQPAGTLGYNIQFSGLVPTAAHVHTGAAGVAGGILFPLTQTGPNTYSGTSPALTNAALVNLATAGLYANIHTAAFPGGEIRDQLHIGYLNGDTDTLSVSRGGTQTLHVAAGAANAGKLYFTFGSLAGTAPGIPVDSVVLPLNFDGYLNFTLTSPNSAILSSSLGFLAAGGVATPRFNLPPAAVPALAGATVNHAVVVFDIPGLGTAKLASQPKACAFVP